MSDELAKRYRRRGTFDAFVWTETMGEVGPVERYYSGRLDNGAPSSSYLAVRDKDCGGGARDVWDGCVVVSNGPDCVRATSREDFDAEYEPLESERERLLARSVYKLNEYARHGVSCPANKDACLSEDCEHCACGLRELRAKLAEVLVPSEGEAAA